MSLRPCCHAALNSGVVISQSGLHFFRDPAQILAQLLQRRPTEKPVAIVDLVDNESRLKHERVRDHGIVRSIRIFADVEIFLNDASRVGKKRPMRADAGAVFVRFDDAVGADGHQPAISNFHLAMELNQQLGLPTVFWTKPAAAEHEHHRILALQFR